MLLTLILISLLQMTVVENNSVTKNGMTVEWAFINDDQIKFNVIYPSKGWVAIGLNTKNELIGSNLIMACVSNNQSIISDRYIVGFGNHQSMENLGAESKVKLLSAKEDKAGSEFEFILDTAASDSYHFNLERNKIFYLTIAYSHEDDFEHHSAMRTSVKIIL